MKTKVTALLLSALICLGGVAPLGMAAPAENALPFDLSAKAAIVVDATSSAVLAGENEHEKLPMASVTKVMTLLLIMEALDQGQYTLEDDVVVSPYAASMGGSQALLDANGVYTVSELIKSIIVASANDSSVALAEFTDGSAEGFVNRMNRRAAELGMVNTNFVNCNGLPAENHYSTAYDIALMSRELIKYPLFFSYSSIWLDEIQHSGGRVTMLSNTNKLLRTYDGCDGLKTGSTNAAGYCMAATAQRGNSRFIAVVLGDDTSQQRFDNITMLLNYAFASYTHTVLFDADEIAVPDIPVRGGKAEAINAVCTQRVVALTSKGDDTQVETEIELPAVVDAPVEQRSYIGTMKVYVNGELTGTYPLAADQGVERAGFWDYVVKIASTFQ
ncbi:MAG: D-alanyl-D-alanine carboxypeptidase [Eubacteriales bacterium]|nr:D-alanyl-D-alanine carboxypeptidase [Eubacteriales bacterium]